MADKLLEKSYSWHEQQLSGMRGVPAKSDAALVAAFYAELDEALHPKPEPYRSPQQQKEDILWRAAFPPDGNWP